MKTGSGTPAAHRGLTACGRNGSVPTAVLLHQESESAFFRHRSNTLILAAILVAAASLRLLYVLTSAPVDDAYITYRYARNLAAGNGFVYNLGERVLGTTTPLFTLLLVPFGAMSLPLDGSALVLGLLADLLACALLFLLLLREVRVEMAFLGLSLYAFLYAGGAACGYGMETQVFQFFLLAAVYAAARGWWRRAALAAGLATLTRPEGLLVTGILGAALVIKTLRAHAPVPWKPAVVWMAVVAPWVAFASFYFGSPIPNSVIAKSLQAGIGVHQWADFFFFRNPVVLLLWCGSVLGAALAFRNRSFVLVLLSVWAAAYPLFFLAGRPAFLGIWYFLPVTVPLSALSAYAAAGVLGPLLGSARRAALPAVILWLGATAVLLPRSLEATRWGRRNADAVYRPMGRWVRENTSPDELVQVSDIGYVGFISGRRILDSSALVSPEVWRFRQAHRGDPNWDVRLVLDRRPDLLLLPIKGNVYTRFRDGGLLDRYRPVRRFSTLGAGDLNPPDDPGSLYKDPKLYIADFIVYRRIRTGG
jgi:hypothetical protein